MARYELAYIESTQGVARGQHVWQLAFGSGFKFNSAVLKATRHIHDEHAAWDNFDSVVGAVCVLHRSLLCYAVQASPSCNFLHAASRS